MGNSGKNFYETLHIKETATHDEIKIAYRRLARIYHPDISENPQSIAIFKEIREAYETLSNEEKRKIYDSQNGFNIPEKQETEQEEIKDEFIKEENKPIQRKTFSQIFGEIIDGIFVYAKNVSSSSKNKPQKGEDIFANVVISPKEALFGTNRIVNVMQTGLCPNCAGKKFINEALCPLCKGSGEISSHKRINVKIPANTKNNDRIKVENAGNQGINGGKSGDLFLIITIDEKSLFTVKDNIVYMDLPITAFEAALGANIQIPTFYEDITIKIPPNTSSGQKFRLKGQGIISKDKSEIGDMIVTVYIKMPHKLSNREIALYNELKDANSFNVREDLKNNE